jgi:rubredoxin
MSEPCKRWVCESCGFVYDEALGAPEDGIAPGTLWVDIPKDWFCPQCGMEKASFAMMELA